MNRNTRMSARRGWSSSYPVGKKDGIQKILDPVLDNRLFSGAVFLLIIYSMYNLYLSYQADTPVQMEQISRLSSLISAVFMLEFVLKFASRRFAYLKKEGIVDFLAASDFFSPAVRATKFVRFLRVLRLLRVVRGVKMMQKRASRIEDSIFTSFSAATIIVMLVFVAVKSHYDWQTTKDRIHARLLPVLSSVEERLQTDDQGLILPTDQLGSVEVDLVEHPDFISAEHTPSGSSEPDWQLAAEREVSADRLRQVIREIDGLKERPRWNDVPDRQKRFVDREVLEILRETPTAAALARVRNRLYLRRQHAESNAARGTLSDALALLESVPVYFSRVEPSGIQDYLDRLSTEHFSEEILTIEHQNASGMVKYRFLLDEEYSEAREDEFSMLIATFILIILIVLVLNIALKDVIGPLGEMAFQTANMASEGRLDQVTLTRRPDNEISDIADHLNKIAEKDN